MSVRKPLQKVFSAQKIHTNKRKVIFLVEILVTILLIVGTSISFVALDKFAPSDYFKKVTNLALLKRPSQKTQEKSFEEKIKEVIDKKILDVTAVEKSNEGYYIVKSREEVNVVMVADKDLGFQARTLQTVLSKAKIENRVASLVDFRFDKIVVQYSR
ncbi:MAG: hypothetical protein Q8O75_02320 [bacterium]|nr:hypothetical protein [bacterium]